MKIFIESLEGEYDSVFLYSTDINPVKNIFITTLEEGEWDWCGNVLVGGKEYKSFMVVINGIRKSINVLSLIGTVVFLEKQYETRDDFIKDCLIEMGEDVQ